MGLISNDDNNSIKMTVCTHDENAKAQEKKRRAKRGEKNLIVRYLEVISFWLGAENIVTIFVTIQEIENDPKMLQQFSRSL